MIKDISVGRYFPGDSIFHRLDPRVKAIMFFLYMAAVFFVSTPVGMLLVFAVTLVQTVAAKIPFHVLRATVKPVLPLALFILIINIFASGEGNVLFHFRFIKITDFGIERAVLMASRLILLIVSTSVLLTLTTTPLKLSDALEKLFSPLRVIKVPVHEMSMMMSIALRFIPTLVEETDKIMKAQVSRGADYDTGNIFSRARGYVTVLVPLFVSSFKRAEELAIAMDARCYRGGEGRTKLHPLKMTSSDWIVGIVLGVGAAGLAAADIFIRSLG